MSDVASLIRSAAQERCITWVIDFDGTLVSGNAGQEFVQQVSGYKRRTISQAFLAVLLAAINIFSTFAFQRKIFSAWSIGITEEEIQNLENSFSVDFSQSTKWNKPLVDLLNSRPPGVKAIVVTGSMSSLVKKIIAEGPIAKIDEICGMESGPLRIVSHHPLGRRKLKYVPATPFLGVGDSWSDRFLLRRSEISIVVPGDNRLENMAVKNGWVVLPNKP